MTYTDENGELDSLEVRENADWSDRAWHRLDRWLPSISMSSLPFFATAGEAIGGVLETGVLVAAEPVTA